MFLEYWKQASTLETGTGHVSSKKPCQDRVAYGKSEGIHVLALADGLGSLSSSHIGAEIATKTIVKLMLQQFYDYLDSTTNDGEKEEDFLTRLNEAKKTLLHGVTSAMVEYTKNNPHIKLEDMGCTLHFVAYNLEHVIVGHLGDGVIGTLKKIEEQYVIETIAPPQKPKGAEANKTYHILQPEAPQILDLFSLSLKNHYGFIMMSDGPMEVLYRPRVGLLPQVTDLFLQFKTKSSNEFATRLNRFLIDSIATQTDDDLSINMIFLEETPYLTNISEPQPGAEMILSCLKHTNQLIQRSSYGYFIDDSFGPTLTSKPVLTLVQAKGLIR